MASVRYVAIGDSFTEGVGDELPDGIVRGWADLAAQGWADASGEAVQYANLAIRGKLIHPIVDQQLEPALALKPTHLSFNGGGNDMLRPRADVERIVEAFDHVVRRCDEEGVQLIVLSGANPSRHLPLGRVVRSRGDRLSRAVEDRLRQRPDVITAYNWFDAELSASAFWSVDRLHMNARGHHRVAARVIQSLGLSAPGEWWHLDEIPTVESLKSTAYYREHVAPWVRRRLAGTSSGDGRPAKFGGGWVELTPAGQAPTAAAPVPPLVDGSAPNATPSAKRVDTP